MPDVRRLLPPLRYPADHVFNGGRNRAKLLYHLLAGHSFQDTLSRLVVRRRPIAACDTGETILPHTSHAARNRKSHDCTNNIAVKSTGVLVEGSSSYVLLPAAWLGLLSRQHAVYTDLPQIPKTYAQDGLQVLFCYSSFAPGLFPFFFFCSRFSLPYHRFLPAPSVLPVNEALILSPKSPAFALLFFACRGR